MTMFPLASTEHVVPKKLFVLTLFPTIFCPFCYYKKMAEATVLHKDKKFIALHFWRFKGVALVCPGET